MIPSGGVAPFCYSPQNDISCDNGLCFFNSNQIATCNCVVGWTGDKCDQKEGKQPNNNNDTWMYVVFPIIVVGAVAGGVVGYLIRRRKRQQYDPIH